MRFKVSLDEMFVYKMAAAANQISQATLERAKNAVKNVAIMSEGKARELASQRLNSTRQQYEDALSFRESSHDVWTLSLDDSAAHLEQGFSSFDQIERGLASKKPPEGRAKMSKDGHTYIRIPFEHKQNVASPSNPMYAVPVQRGQAGESTRGSLAGDLKYLKRIFGDTGTTTTTAGVPVQGKVYTITKSQEGPRWNYNDVMGNQRSLMLGGEEDRNVSPLLSGLTKVQTQIGKKMKSSYMTWRTASTKMLGQGKFIHPGFSGIHAFDDLERWAIDTLSKNLQEVFTEGR